LVEEFVRVLAPKSTDVDWADELGLSDTIIDGQEVAEEIARLDRDELLLTGRTLRIVWAEGDEAARIRAAYFADSTW
jgi:hypothetical protein